VFVLTATAQLSLPVGEAKIRADKRLAIRTVPQNSVKERLQKTKQKIF